MGISNFLTLKSKRRSVFYSSTFNVFLLVQFKSHPPIITHIYQIYMMINKHATFESSQIKMQLYFQPYIVFKLLIIIVYNWAACDVIGLPINPGIVLQTIRFLIKTHFVLVSSIGFQAFDYLTAGFLTALILQLLVTYAASKMERYPLVFF